MIRTRLALLASLRAGPDAIEFAGSIADARCALELIEAHAFAAIAYGSSPGDGTKQQLKAVADGIYQLIGL